MRAHRPWLNSAVVAQAVLAVYLQVVEWIPLGRWNNVRNGNGQESLDVVIALIQVAIIIAYAKRWRWPMIAGLGAYIYWAYAQITSWWVPYVLGASPQWMRVYDKWFGGTYRFLPRIGDHPIPDADHTVLFALVVLTVALCIREIWRDGRRHTLVRVHERGRDPHPTQP